MFGTGGLLRALVATAIDDANRSGAFHGGIVALQTTPDGWARALSRQDGLFTLVERGLNAGVPVDRTRMIGSITRGLVASGEWPAVRDVVSRPELRAIVSNVTEAGFAIDERDTRRDANAVPFGFPAKLTELLYARFQRIPGGPPLTVIPTELVPDNVRACAKWSRRLSRTTNTNRHLATGPRERVFLLFARRPNYHRSSVAA